MTTSTITRNSNTTGMKVMTWQAVQKMAKEMGVGYFKNGEHYRASHYGIMATSFNRGFGDQTCIEIVRSYKNNPNAEWLSQDFNRIAEQNFFLKLELWALKNGVTYTVTNNGHLSYIQIAE